MRRIFSKSLQPLLLFLRLKNIYETTAKTYRKRCVKKFAFLAVFPIIILSCKAGASNERFLNNYQRSVPAMSCSLLTQVLGLCNRRSRWNFSQEARDLMTVTTLRRASVHMSSFMRHLVICDAIVLFFNN